MDIRLYVKDGKLVAADGGALAKGRLPVVRWREQVDFRVSKPTGTFAQGNYSYAFDVDRDFLGTSPCNAGACAVDGGDLVFSVLFSSERQAERTNGRVLPIPFFMQLTSDGGDYVDYILDDAIWVNGCVWDGHGAPAQPASAYYTKEQIDEILAGISASDPNNWIIIGG